VSSRVLNFVDLEAMAIGWLNSHLTSPRRASTDLPQPLEGGLPLVQVIMSTGSADDEVTAHDRLDVYCMAATRAAMWALTAETHGLMGRLTELDGGPVGVDKVVCVMRPSFLAWSPTVPRSIAVYEIQTRPRLATT
jgi:hypothetical protein